MSKIVIKLEHDHDVDNPCTEDGWKVHSFSSNHGTFTEPSELGLDEDGEPDEALRAKIKSGLAFVLSYYEHGGCEWSLQGEGQKCRWDSVRLAGLMIWEQDVDNLGALSYEDREKDARENLNVFNQWCNGHTFWYSAVRVADCKSCGQEEEVEDLDSCGGFIGHEHLFDHIREALDLEGETVEFRGEADYLADYYKETASA